MYQILGINQCNINLRLYIWVRTFVFIYAAVGKKLVLYKFKSVKNKADKCYLMIKAYKILQKTDSAVVITKYPYKIKS